MAKTKTKYRRKSLNANANPRGLHGRVAEVEATMLRTDLPEFKAGDTVRVHVKIKEGEKERIQPYEGLIIAISNAGSNRAILVRKISHGVGVERTFALCSPKVAKLEIVQTGRVRRAKLYYIRGLEGKAARIEREVETLASAAASAAAKEKPAASKKK